MKEVQSNVASSQSLSGREYANSRQIIGRGYRQCLSSPVRTAGDFGARQRFWRVASSRTAHTRDSQPAELIDGAIMAICSYWTGASSYQINSERPCCPCGKKLRQQHHQRTCAAFGRSCLDKGQHFLLLNQPALHAAFKHRCFSGRA